MKTAVLVLAATLGVGCARYNQAGGEIEMIDPVAAKQTVVLDVKNLNVQPMELRAIVNGQSRFVGSVSGSDSTSLLLDPALFPTGTLYLTAIPGDGAGRAIVGPIGASKGDRIRFTIQQTLSLSHAIVTR